MDTRFDGAWARHGQGGRKLALTDYEGHPLSDRLMTRHSFLAATGVRAGAALFGLASCGGSSPGGGLRRARREAFLRSRSGTCCRRRRRSRATRRDSSRTTSPRTVSRPSSRSFLRFACHRSHEGRRCHVWHIGGADRSHVQRQWGCLRFFCSCKTTEKGNALVGHDAP